MSAVALLIPIVLVLLANVAIYAGLFLLARRGMRRLLPSMVGLWHNGAAAVLVVIVVVGVPTAYNAFYRHERQALVSGDIAWTGSLTHTKTLAILTDAPEDPNWYDRKECGPLRCRALLYHHAVDAVLVAFPPPIGDRLNAAMRVTRYRLDHRTWCPPIEHMDERRHGRNLDQLAAAAAGECLISEPATLGDADVIVLDQTFAPRRIALDIPTEGRHLCPRWRPLARSLPEDLDRRSGLVDSAPRRHTQPRSLRVADVRRRGTWLHDRAHDRSRAP
jgi:hypothetical protein